MLVHGGPGRAGGVIRARGDRAMQQALFDKYGGFSTVSRIVLALYDRLLDDDDVGGDPEPLSGLPENRAFTPCAPLPPGGH